MKNYLEYLYKKSLSVRQYEDVLHKKSLSVRQYEKIISTKQEQLFEIPTRFKIDDFI